MGEKRSGDVLEDGEPRQTEPGRSPPSITPRSGNKENHPSPKRQRGKTSLARRAWMHNFLAGVILANARYRPVTSQRMTLPSLPAVATVWPSGEQSSASIFA